MTPEFLELAERAADIGERLAIVARLDDRGAAEDLVARLWYVATDLNELVKSKAHR